VSDGLLKLTVYFGESDRAAGRLASEAVTDLYQSADIRLAVLLRGIQGFGLRHHMHTDRVLTLSEDLPLVSIAVDSPERIQGVAAGLRRLLGDGLVTLERARAAGTVPRGDPHAKLTVYCGRGEWRDAANVLRTCGLAGATALLGVDGMMGGERRRGRFFAHNRDVPAMLIGTGEPAAVERALAEVGRMPTRPAVTLERITLLKRGGNRVADVPHVPDRDATNLNLWQRLTVHAGEDASHGGHALHLEIVRRLRRAGAAGATSLRGIWGYTDDGPEHIDRPFSLARRVPVTTVVADTPDRIRGWFEVIDELTDTSGMVTSEVVPAFRAVSREHRQGGLRLAQTEPPPDAA
jgi:PII-like signaling protein